MSLMTQISGHLPSAVSFSGRTLGAPVLGVTACSTADMTLINAVNEDRILTSLAARQPSVPVMINDLKHFAVPLPFVFYFGPSLSFQSGSLDI